MNWKKPSAPRSRRDQPPIEQDEQKIKAAHNSSFRDLLKRKRQP